MFKLMKSAIALLFTLSIFTGLFYPLFITGIAQLLFSHQANGSILIKNGQVIGSELVGQQFNDPKYFWGRPSASSGEAYNSSASGGSNYSVLNPDLEREVTTRIEALRNADPQSNQPIPVDLVTSSASGLDPDISVAAAEYQAARVAEARGIPLDQVNHLIQEYTQPRLLGIFGEETVNVLQINLALDELK